MINLDIPLKGVPQGEIFDKCVSGFSPVKNRERVARLHEIKQAVVEDSDSYPQMLHRVDKTYIRRKLSRLLTKDLIALYEEKFAKESSPGRKYYDRIKASSPHNVCPFCGVGQVSTLDHYLPKSKYPTLSVTPSNLIPACSDCNRTKSATDDLLVHAYFDIIPADRPWLFATIIDGKPVTVSYHVSCPEDWNSSLIEKIENHFKTLDLGRLYSIKAGEELSSYRAYEEYLREHGIEDLPGLFDKVISMEISTGRLNSWKCALYRALKDHYEQLSTTHN